MMQMNLCVCAQSPRQARDTSNLFILRCSTSSAHEPRDAPRKEQTIFVSALMISKKFLTWLQLDEAKSALASAREQHKESEAMLRKAKKRAQQVNLLCGTHYCQLCTSRVLKETYIPI